ncbi:septum formation protein Maf [Candidatus Termititenax dinenymphae]|uniref:dTTP/UTP pyrophosphatase n=1 Tax=Candidatus Termititenax dinenymphae TaxID=2218523 RepID=A0A388TM57_9BACT|nr:septum formation protein Maf [Candidatus Termititenax dinenymphae]
MRKIVLVSGSPRRKELLKNLGLKFTVFIPNVPEQIRDRHYKRDIVKVVRAKLDSASCRAKELLIACDTIVVCGGKVLGKPQDAHQAAGFLKMLSGRKHIVYSCLAVKYRQGGQAVYKHRLVATEVYFRRITPAEITAYLRTPVPYDKAGAYGIQENKGLFVRKISGCYYNVVGLPVNDLIDMLKSIK